MHWASLLVAKSSRLRHSSRNNRYNGHQLIIEDAELRKQLFGGSFRADNYNGFVQLLERRFGVVAERAGETTILRRAK
jgi:transmembrane sensor